MPKRKKEPPNLPEHRPGDRGEWKGKKVEIRAVGLDSALVILPSGHQEWVPRDELTLVYPEPFGG